MDFGTKVICNKCRTVTYMYYDTHGLEWGTVGGLCPICNSYLTSRITKENCEMYPPSDSYVIGQKITPGRYYENI